MKKLTVYNLHMLEQTHNMRERIQEIIGINENIYGPHNKLLSYCEDIVVIADAINAVDTYEKEHSDLVSRKVEDNE